MTADTNIYVYTLDKRDLVKQRIAIEVAAALRVQGAMLPLQLIGEFQHVLRRKLKAPAAFAASEGLALITSHRTFAYTEAAAILALNEAAHGRLGYWDALMLASAAEAGCTAMLSEDMQDGARIFGLEIVNPFAAHGVSIRAAELLNLT